MINQIIPAISFIRDKFRIKFPTMLSQDPATKYRFSPSLELGDIKQSDAFFDSILFK